MASLCILSVLGQLKGSCGRYAGYAFLIPKTGCSVLLLFTSHKLQPKAAAHKYLEHNRKAGIRKMLAQRGIYTSQFTAAYRFEMPVFSHFKKLKSQ